jgi:hypothetical protein
MSTNSLGPSNVANLPAVAKGSATNMRQSQFELSCKMAIMSKRYVVAPMTIVWHTCEMISGRVRVCHNQYATVVRVTSSVIHLLAIATHPERRC